MSYVQVYESRIRRQVSTRCTDLKGAELALRHFERDLADPANAAAKKASLSDALKLLLERRTEEATAGRRSHETVAFYRRKACLLTRMVERVYGRLSPEEIGALLTQHFALDCIAGASVSVDSAGKRGRNGRSRRRNPAKTVPRGGIEPPTRGFSVPCSTN